MWIILKQGKSSLCGDLRTTGNHPLLCFSHNYIIDDCRRGPDLKGYFRVKMYAANILLLIEYIPVKQMAYSYEESWGFSRDRNNYNYYRSFTHVCFSFRIRNVT